MASIHEIASGLRGRRVGDGWMACCPAPEDAEPSLSLCQRNGKLLVYCFGGCWQSDVIAALRDRGLWPQPKKSEGPRPRPDPDRAGDMSRASYWKEIAVLLAKWALEEIELTDPARMPLMELVRVLGLGDEAVLAEYRSWRKREPKLRAGMVNAGRQSDARLRRQLTEWIEGGLRGKFGSLPL